MARLCIRPIYIGDTLDIRIVRSLFNKNPLKNVEDMEWIRNG